MIDVAIGTRYVLVHIGWLPIWAWLWGPTRYYSGRGWVHCHILWIHMLLLLLKLLLFYAANAVAAASPFAADVVVDADDHIVFFVISIEYTIKFKWRIKILNQTSKPSKCPMNSQNINFQQLVKDKVT